MMIFVYKCWSELCHPVVPLSVSEVLESSVHCVTGRSNKTGDHRITLHYGSNQRHLHTKFYRYTDNPDLTSAMPSKSFVE